LLAPYQSTMTAGSSPTTQASCPLGSDRDPPADVVLEVRRFAARGAGDRLDVVRPAPTGLEDEAADLAAADLEDLGAAVRELAYLVRRLEALLLALVPVHLVLLSRLIRL
jgi:hypothetical protein